MYLRHDVHHTVIYYEYAHVRVARCCVVARCTRNEPRTREYFCVLLVGSQVRNSLLIYSEYYPVPGTRILVLLMLSCSHALVLEFRLAILEAQTHTAKCYKT